MNQTTKRWLTGCGIGCGVVVVLGILSVVGGSFFLMGPFRQAIATREALEERFGDQASYTPAADGAVPAERLEAFLAVRAAVMELCDEFGATAAQFLKMEQLDEDDSGTQAMIEGLKLTKDVINLVPQLGRLYRARNEALATVGMGLGEYSYIYIMAYRDRIGADNAASASPFGDSVASSRLREILRGMLRRQLESARATEGEGPEVGDLREELTAEVARLEEDHGRLPWQDGLPAALAASLDPFRERLDAVFCQPIAGIELNVNEQRGLSIHGR